MLGLLYLALFVPLIVLLSLCLKKVLKFNNDSLIIPIVAFLILQIIPLPRMGQAPDDFFMLKPIPPSIGFGYPFTMVNYYTDSVCNMYPIFCDDPKVVEKRLGYPDPIVAESNQKYSIKKGEIRYTGSNVAGAYLWAPLLAVSTMIFISIGEQSSKHRKKKK